MSETFDFYKNHKNILDNKIFFDYFELNNNFTYEELKRMYTIKTNMINSMNISQTDKYLYIYYINKLYKQAKKYINHKNNSLINDDILDDFFRSSVLNWFDYLENK